MENEGRTPHRIQRKRTRGWRMPPNTVYVGRPTRWGNPFIYDDPAEAVKQFRDTLIIDKVSSLRGKNLACWCPLNKPCHADVLLEIANR